MVAVLSVVCAVALVAVAVVRLADTLLASAWVALSWLVAATRGERPEPPPVPGISLPLPSRVARPRSTSLCSRKAISAL